MFIHNRSLSKYPLIKEKRSNTHLWNQIKTTILKHLNKHSLITPIRKHHHMSDCQCTDSAFLLSSSSFFILNCSLSDRSWYKRSQRNKPQTLVRIHRGYANCRLRMRCLAIEEEEKQNGEDVEAFERKIPPLMWPSVEPSPCSSHWKLPWLLCTPFPDWIRKPTRQTEVSINARTKWSDSPRICRSNW